MKKSILIITLILFASSAFSFDRSMVERALNNVRENQRKIFRIQENLEDVTNSLIGTEEILQRSLDNVEVKRYHGECKESYYRPTPNETTKCIQGTANYAKNAKSCAVTAALKNCLLDGNLKENCHVVTTLFESSFSGRINYICKASTIVESI